MKYYIAGFIVGFGSSYGCVRFVLDLLEYLK